MNHLIVGIDPQPTCIGYCVRGENFKPNYNCAYMKKKQSFKKSNLWQAYVFSFSSNFIDELIEGHQRYGVIETVVVEQQRGRINSLIEATIYTLCKMKLPNAKILLVHPTTWHSKVNLGGTKGGSHYANKKLSVTAFQKVVEKTETTSKETNIYRLADMADAYWLCDWGGQVCNLTLQ